MPVAEEFLEANARYAARFEKGHLPMPPGRKVAVLVCMDARIDPARALGLEEGDAHVIRNAGGRAADALRSLIISQQLLGTREVVVIHHTDCGMLTFTDPQLRAKLKAELGQGHGPRVPVFRGRRGERARGRRRASQLAPSAAGPGARLRVRREDRSAAGSRLRRRPWLPQFG